VYRHVSFAVVAGIFCLLQPANAQGIKFPIVEKADGDFDTCAFAEVTGLNGVDGFLAVRSGPNETFDEIDRLKNSDRVWVYQKLGKWFGIVYDLEEVDCSPIEEDRAVKTDGKKGWVHEDWIQILAG
jgi:hypothetical protein